MWSSPTGIIQRVFFYKGAIYNYGDGVGNPHLVEKLGSDDNRETVTTPRLEGRRAVSSRTWKESALLRKACELGQPLMINEHRQRGWDPNPCSATQASLLPHPSRV